MKEPHWTTFNTHTESWAEAKYPLPEDMCVCVGLCVGVWVCACVHISMVFKYKKKATMCQYELCMHMWLSGSEA